MDYYALQIILYFIFIFLVFHEEDSDHAFGCRCHYFWGTLDFPLIFINLFPFYMNYYFINYLISYKIQNPDTVVNCEPIRERPYNNLLKFPRTGKPHVVSIVVLAWMLGLVHITNNIKYFYLPISYVLLRILDNHGK